MAALVPNDRRQDCHLGVLAFGDSITNGGGELQWGVALQSWALWVARALGLPFTNYAVDGAGVTAVVGEQIPAFERSAAAPSGPYDLGCLYIGVNDVRALDWDPAAYARDLEIAAAFLRARCQRTVMATAPLDLGRPRAGTKVRELNEIIRRVARAHDALVIDLHDFGARDLVMADHVHPTAFGQISIAERALHVLAADGLSARVAPRSLIRYDPTWLERLREDCTQAYRRTKTALRTAWILTSIRVLGRIPE